MNLDLQTDLQPDLGLVGTSIKKLQSNPLPMQYLGGKGRISNWIIDVLRDYFPESKYILTYLVEQAQCLWPPRIGA